MSGDQTPVQTLVVDALLTAEHIRHHLSQACRQSQLVLLKRHRNRYLGNTGGTLGDSVERIRAFLSVQVPFELN